MAPKSALVAALAMTAVPTAVALPTQDNNDLFIVGGEPARAGEFPYIVAITRNGALDCGGTLLNANTVLTAAHCTNPNNPNAQVRAGTLTWRSGGTIVNVASTVIHPDYNEANLDNDIAIWKLRTPIRESSTIKYATLSLEGSDPQAGSTATVAGWGTLQEGGQASPTLQKVSVPVVDRPTCRASYPGLTDNMVCAGLKQGGKDSCQGDSGGPMIDATTRALTGVVSWGIGCARPNNYGVYTRVGNYIDFIKRNL